MSDLLAVNNLSSSAELMWVCVPSVMAALLLNGTILIECGMPRSSGSISVDVGAAFLLPVGSLMDAMSSGAMET
eukprot:CAMPEP_0181134544 /NCGR_PEP_ID=MMETSP1071-20121207/32144_1 /TAXON_ID=35127 /ORGANISM="Thalassiosira sp., Strain NH16" /LENGTH=73 /DNA_ID=CAMNT_0023221069 /DNA_START=598 /DNA_END=819 /DNA_ORIENTATION=+